MRFRGGDAKVALTGEGSLPGHIYYATAESRGALTGPSAFRRVRYAGLYPGIDLVYYGNDRQLEFDLVVAPHVDPNQIHLSFSGADKVALTEEGEISLRVAGEEVRLKRPSLYQERDGIRAPVSGGYVARRRTTGRRFGSPSAPTTRPLPLTIDPVIAFGTYAGGEGDELLTAVAVNAAGATYLLGTTTDAQFLQAGTAFSLGTATPTSCFLEKVSPDGSSLLYTVLFVGAATCPAMAVDSQDRVHLVSWRDGPLPCAHCRRTPPARPRSRCFKAASISRTVPCST